MFKWRRAAQQQVPAAVAPFIPVMLADGGSGDGDEPCAVHCGAIEVELAGACIRIHGAVSKATLKTVLAALRETA